jgi:branched-chain amino acid transport system substrate-binding protein
MAEERHMGQAQDQNGRRKILRLAVMGTALFVAGCAVVPKGPPKTVDRPPEKDPTGPVQLPTDVERHRIAILVPMTGENGGVGQSIANAATMAVLDTGGKRIRVTAYDTAAGATAAAQKALADGSKLILGPLLADDVRAVSAVARSARVPLIAFSNDVSVAGNGTYLMGFTPGQSVTRIISYARGKGMTKFAALVPNGLYGQRAQGSFTRAVEAGGGSIVAIQSFDRSAGSINGAISRLALKPGIDAVLIADSGRVAVQAVPIMRRGPVGKAQILGTELWNTETSLSKASALHGAWFASVSDGLYDQLAVKYRARFGKSPYRLASLGYDSVLLATKIAGSWKVGTAFPVAALSDAGGFAGIDGAFRFGSSGIAERALEVQEVKPTGFSIIAPAPRTFTN